MSVGNQFEFFAPDDKDWRRPPAPPRAEPPSPALRLHVTLEFTRKLIQLHWRATARGQVMATGLIRCTGRDELAWELTAADRQETRYSTHHLTSIRGALRHWRARLPVSNQDFTASGVHPPRGAGQPRHVMEQPFGPGDSPWTWLEDNI